LSLYRTNGAEKNPIYL